MRQLAAADVLRLQRQIGNTAVVGLMQAQAGRIQRNTTRVLDRPNEDVLGTNCWEDLRADLADDQATFQVIKSLAKAPLTFLVPIIPADGQVAATRQLVRSVAEARQSLGPADLGGLLLALQAAGISNAAVAGTMGNHADFLHARRGQIVDAVWATQQADPAGAYDLLERFRAHGPEAMALAKTELLTAGGVVATATNVTDYLLPFLTKGDDIMSLARGELTAAGGVTATATDVMQYLVPFFAMGAAIMSLARGELAKANGSTAKAKQGMDALARYNYDPQLQIWADEKAGKMATARVGKAEASATATKNDKVSQLEVPTEPKAKASKTAKLKYSKEVTKYKKEVDEFETEEGQAKLVAKAQEPTWKDEARTDIEASIATETNRAGAGPAGWAIQTAEGDGAIASQLVRLYSGTDDATAKDFGPWAVALAGADPTRMTKLVDHLLKAHAGPLLPVTAKSVAEFLLATPTYRAQDVVPEAVSDTPGWDTAKAFLALHAVSATSAIRALALARKQGMDVQALKSLVDEFNINDCAWALDRTTTGPAGVRTIMSLLVLVKSKRGVLDGLLALTDASALTKLVDDQTNVGELEIVLTRAKAKGIAGGDLGPLTMGQKLPDVAWALEQTKTDAVETAAILKVLPKVYADKVGLASLLALLDIAIIETLVKHEQSAPSLVTLLGVVTHDKLDKLYKKKLKTATLKKYLVTEVDKVDVDDLLAAAEKATADQLTTILQHLTPRSDLVAVLNLVNATTAVTLLSKYSDTGYHSLDILNAEPVKGDWDRGTFADSVRTIVYHYNKHVVDELVAGRAKSVAVYTAEAKTHNEDGTQNRTAEPDNVELVGVHGGRRGRFRNGKVITFWYF
ncbi:MAG: hypothetical protein M3N98_00720 [Actinomycetota bacterium]|nr:hypothetical protein [Actinomycetota bacterium]